MFNASLQQGYVPSIFKSAFITPLLKKLDLDSADVKSYRPISNLSVLSKLLEHLVTRLLLDYLNAYHPLPDCQSTYRSYRSTETAILKVMSDILLALDSGDLAMLTLLYLSAAFDTVDHYILLERLNISYGISHSVLGWLTNYLSNHTQFVQLNGSCSKSSVVPPGSVLGPILFLLYTADLTRLVDAHNLQVHLNADNTQRILQVFRMPCLPVSTTYLRG